MSRRKDEKLGWLHCVLSRRFQLPDTALPTQLPVFTPMSFYSADEEEVQSVLEYGAPVGDGWCSADGLLFLSRVLISRATSPIGADEQRESYVHPYKSPNRSKKPIQQGE